MSDAELLSTYVNPEHEGCSLVTWQQRLAGGGLYTETQLVRGCVGKWWLRTPSERPVSILCVVPILPASAKLILERLKDE